MARIFECSACGRLVKSDKNLAIAPCSKCQKGKMEEFAKVETFVAHPKEQEPKVQKEKVPAPPVNGAVSQQEYKQREPAKEVTSVVMPSKDELKNAYLEGFKEGVQHGFDSGFLTGREAEQIKMASNMPDEGEEDDDEEYENGPISEEDLDDAEGDMGEEEE